MSSSSSSASPLTHHRLQRLVRLAFTLRPSFAPCLFVAFQASVVTLPSFLPCAAYSHLLLSNMHLISNLASLLSAGCFIHAAGAAVLPQVAFKVSLTPLVIEPTSNSSHRPPLSKSANLTMSKYPSMLTITSMVSPSSSATTTSTTTLRLSSSHATQRTRTRSLASPLTHQSILFLSGLPTCPPMSTSLLSMPMPVPGLA